MCTDLDEPDPMETPEDEVPIQAKDRLEFVPSLSLLTGAFDTDSLFRSLGVQPAFGFHAFVGSHKYRECTAMKDQRPDGLVRVKFLDTGSMLLPRGWLRLTRAANPAPIAS